MTRRKLQSSALALALLAGPTHALFQQYCSSQNTGSSFTPVYWPYQSNGYCHDLCLENYAFAIVQNLNCWCSNTIPSQQIDVSNCNQPCPGYGDFENCGNEGSGLYGYVALERVSPSGAGSSNPSTSTPARSTSRPNASITPSATVSTQVITVSGTVATRTVTATLMPNSGSGSIQSDSKSLSGGAIAGVIVGALAALAVIAFAAFLLWKRRRASDLHSQDSVKPRRTTSMLSRTGLLSRTHAPGMSERSQDEAFQPYNVAGGNSARHSLLFSSPGNDNIVVQPASPLGSSHGDGADLGRRQSRPMVYDQRLNPTALFANAEANGSRVSMQDQHDYSRPLGIANPDPRPSFESRVSHG